MTIILLLLLPGEVIEEGASRDGQAYGTETGGAAARTLKSQKMPDTVFL